MQALDYLMTNILNRDFFFEAISDASGVQGISLMVLDDDGSPDHYYILNDHEEFDDFMSNLFSSKCWKICWDTRSLVKLGIPFKKYCDIIDLSFLCEGDNLMQAGNKYLKDSDVEEFQKVRRKMGSHVRACKTAMMDLTQISLTDVVPSKIMLSYYNLRSGLMMELIKKIGWDHAKTESEILYPKIKTFYEMEQHGICVDPEIKYDPNRVGDNRLMSDIKRRVALAGRNFVYSGFNLKNATKTGRVHPTKHSFNCMNMPKTSVRRSIISRFYGGQICSIDLNAADYRCIVSAIDDPFLNGLYKDAEDFHDKTVELMFGVGNSNPLRRKVVKDVTYSAIYGGSVETISKHTGLSVSKIQVVTEKMKPVTNPINEFMDELFDKSMAAGYVEDPRGGQIELDGTEHKGKVLALFAQRCCSLAFLDGVVALHNCLSTKASLILFTVHDEVVIDINPSDVGLIQQFKDEMESGTSSLFGIKIKAKAVAGPNYWDLK